MKGFLKEIVSWLMYLAFWFLLISAVYHWIGQPFAVDGASMQHTLEDGERVWMWKLSNIDRFDVIVFPEPTKKEEKDKRLFVKRVIGVPGDTIEYKNDQLIINGKTVVEPYLDEKAKEYTSASNQSFTADFNLQSVTGQVKVPEGKLFVLGDNRRNSVDGRIFSFIDEKDVVGEAEFIYWPLNKFGKVENYHVDEASSSIVKD